MNTKFAQKVIEVVKTLRPGEVATYSGVAALAGIPGASRAVGSIMKNNQDRSVPCHRVICADGRPGGYNQLRSQDKLDLLLQEGVKVKNGKVLFKS